MNKTIKAYENICNKIAKEFSKKYGNDCEPYFIGNDIGGACDFGDILVLDTHDQAMVLRENPTKDRFWEAYEYYVDTEGKDCNLYNLVRYGLDEMKEVKSKNPS